MTICIAAICDKGKSIVLAADRCRWLSTAAIEAEVDEAKYHLLSDQLALMGAGTLQNVKEVMRLVNKMPSPDDTSIAESSDRFLRACHQARAKQIESLYLARHLGMSYDEFRAALTSPSPGSLVVEMYNKTLNYSYDMSLIVAGIDTDGAHLRLIDETSNTSATESSYIAIGSGGTLASISLAKRRQHSSAKLSETIYNVYEAKRNAEFARGVATTTDLSVIRKGRRAITLDNDAIAALAEIHVRLQPKPMSRQDKEAIAKAIKE